MQAASSSLDGGDLAPAERALEMFQEMTEIPSIVLSPIIPQLVAWCLHLASNLHLVHSLREQALTVCMVFQCRCKNSGLWAVRGFYRLPPLGDAQSAMHTIEKSWPTNAQKLCVLMTSRMCECQPPVS